MLAFAIAWTAQAGVSFAEANWWDHLSGPGPFKELFVGYRFLCVSSSVTQQGFPETRVLVNDRTKDLESYEEQPDVLFTKLLPWERTASLIPRHAPPVPRFDSDAIRTFADVRQYRKRAAAADCKRDERLLGYVRANARFAVSVQNDLVAGDSPVHVWGFDLAYVDRIKGPFDISYAVGFNHFFGPSFESFDRISVSPSLEYAPFATHGGGPRAHALRVIAGTMTFLKGFKASDFCNRNEARCLTPRWRTGVELIPHIAVVVDLSMLGGESR